MIAVRKESDEVLYPATDFVAIASSELEELKHLASLNSRKRVRFCAHCSPEERVHEMFIVHARDCYVRPHRHLGKSESMTILEGSADVVLFRADGAILNVFEAGSPVSGRTFYYRLDLPVFHSLLITSDYLIFHEVTEGPFRRKTTEFPEWAPPDGDSLLASFRSDLEARAMEFKKNGRDALSSARC